MPYNKIESINRGEWIILNVHNVITGTNSILPVDFITNQLEVVGEGKKSGWALTGRRLRNYGVTGPRALDFSYSDIRNSGNGAIGNKSTAFGKNVLSSGTLSFTIGENNKSISNLSFTWGKDNSSYGEASTSRGLNNIASGDYSEVSGVGNLSNSFSSTTIGHYSVACKGQTGDEIVDEDELFKVGNGKSIDEVSNAFLIYKNGVILAESLTADKIEESNGNVLITKEYLNKKIEEVLNR